MVRQETHPGTGAGATPPGVPRGGREHARRPAAPGGVLRGDAGAPADRPVRLRAVGRRHRRRHRRRAPGRIILLHDPAGNDAWDGTFRCVAYARAEIELELDHRPDAGRRRLVLADRGPRRPRRDVRAPRPARSPGSPPRASAGWPTRAAPPRSRSAPPGPRSRPGCRARRPARHRRARRGLGRAAVHRRRPAPGARGRHRDAEPTRPARLGTMTRRMTDERRDPTPEGDATARGRPETPRPPEAPPAPLLSCATACRRSSRPSRRLRGGLRGARRRRPGPVAIDAERASGYRYSTRAYLIQLRREGRQHLPGRPDRVRLARPAAGGHRRDRVDPARRHPGPPLPRARWGCARPASSTPSWPGGCSGYPRVGLATLVETVLGYRLAKEHSAVDWSTRPLPKPWLEYAALDVEVLVELREALGAELEAAGKAEWARRSSTTCAASRSRPASTRGGVRRGSTGCAGDGPSRRCAPCGRPATRSPSSAT